MRIAGKKFEKLGSEMIWKKMLNISLDVTSAVKKKKEIHKSRHSLFYYLHDATNLYPLSRGLKVVKNDWKFKSTFYSYSFL